MMVNIPWDPGQQTLLAPGQGLKPTWKGLKRGGDFRPPVSEFVGQYMDWSTYPNRFGDTAVCLKFDRIQVLDQDAPFPYPQLDLEIKYSDQENSAWGKFGTALAQCMGADLDNLDIDLPKGQWLWMVRYDQEPFGWKDKTSGKPVTGFIWRCHAILQPGQAVKAAFRTSPEYKGYMAALWQQHGVGAATITPAVPLLAPVPGFQIPLAPTPFAPPVSNIPMAPAAPTDGKTPENQALYLLNGKDLATFFRDSMGDPTVRKDSNLVNAILSGAWLASLEAANRIKKQLDGTYAVGS